MMGLPAKRSVMMLKRAMQGVPLAVDHDQVEVGLVVRPPNGDRKTICGWTERGAVGRGEKGSGRSSAW